MAALLRLQELFALHEIELKLGEFTLDGFFSAAQVHHIHVKVAPWLHMCLLMCCRLTACFAPSAPMRWPWSALRVLAACRHGRQVDAFDLDDYALNSALGRYDGDVYRVCAHRSAQPASRAMQALFELAQQEPLNKTVVGPGYDEYIRPLLKSKL